MGSICGQFRSQEPRAEKVVIFHQKSSNLSASIPSIK